MTTVYPSTDGYFQQDNALPQSSNQLVSRTFTILKWPPSPDLSPKEHFWDEVGWEICIMDAQPETASNCVILSCQYGPKSAPC